MRRVTVFLTFILLLGVFVDLYAFQGIRVLTSFSGPHWSGWIRSAYWLFSEGLLFALVGSFLLFFPPKKHMWLLNKPFNTFITLFVTKLVVVIFLLGEDIVRALVYVFHSFNGPAGFPDRSVIVSVAGLSVAALPFTAFVFGVTRGKYHYKVHRVTIASDDLPVEFDGFRLVQISDIHSGSLESRKDVRRGVEKIVAESPDLFVFTGDLVNNRAEEIVPLIDTFSAIRATHGQFSVLGNHDYGDYIKWPTAADKHANLNALKRHHGEMGFRLLLDEHVKIAKGDAHITLLGVENWGKGFGERGKLDKALQGVNKTDFKILLSHDPSHWDHQVKNNPVPIHLTLSGHTHGMQFGIEWLGIRWSPVKYRYRNWAGLAEENGRYLYVNRGFGFLGFSGRVGIWPEITVITLKKA